MSILFRKTEVIVFKSSVLGKEKAYKAESAIYDLKMTFTFLLYTSQNLKVWKRAELCIAEGGAGGGHFQHKLKKKIPPKTDWKNCMHCNTLIVISNELLNPIKMKWNSSLWLPTNCCLLWVTYSSFVQKRIQKNYFEKACLEISKKKLIFKRALIHNLLNWKSI